MHRIKYSSIQEQDMIRFLFGTVSRVMVFYVFSLDMKYLSVNESFTIKRYLFFSDSDTLETFGAFFAKILKIMKQ